jgi:AAA15 family ATPase/GTPase
MLSDLTIQNYRGFRDLHIDNLARVNLIVGMNNSGKTSLLEAIYLLVNQEEVQRSLVEFIHNRNDIDKLPKLSGDVNQFKFPRFLHEEIRNLFHGFKSNINCNIYIHSQQEHNLSFTIQKKLDNHNFNQEALEIICSEGSNSAITINLNADGTNIRQGNLPHLQKKPSLLLANSNLNLQQLSELWNNILLTPKENKVVSALQILEPSVRRIGFTNSLNYHSGVLLKLDAYPEPIPLISMGDGMRRILTIAMASVTVENGFLLVDEIETGLYYEAQSDMWRYIFEIAQELNVQVFATTHSWDCIVSFQEALAQSENNSIGKLLRLSRQNNDTRAVEYNSNELLVAVRQGIEVR